MRAPPKLRAKGGPTFRFFAGLSHIVNAHFDAVRQALHQKSSAALMQLWKLIN